MSRGKYLLGFHANSTFLATIYSFYITKSDSTYPLAILACLEGFTTVKI
jgi:hypothetical protein